MKGLLKRNLLESLRDPITLIFAIGLPVFLMLLFSAIGKSVQDIEMFSPDQLTPGIVVFSFSMLMMAEANLIAGDRATSLFARFRTLPIKTSGYVIAYSLPYFVIALLQYVLAIVLAFCFGLKWTPHIFSGLLLTLPVAIVYISLGLIMGFCLNVNQTIGIGNGLVMVFAILSGAWFPVGLVGGAFETIAMILPFYNAVSALRELFCGLTFDFLHVYILLAYTVASILVAFFVSNHRLKSK